VIVDASAIIAILLDEPGFEKYAAAIANTRPTRASAAGYLEIGIVIDGKRDPRLSRRLDDLIATSRISIEPVTERQARIAREAYRDYGKGSGHPAGLNFGDCFAYALARDLGEPLLYKGADFSQTDIKSALPDRPA
jgi:ribonuclease VapC